MILKSRENCENFTENNFISVVIVVQKFFHLNLSSKVSFCDVIGKQKKNCKKKKEEM